MTGGLGGWRQDAIEAEVESFLGIVVRPGAIKNEHASGAGERAAAEKRNGIGEMRVVNFGERRRAEIERFLDGSDEFFLGIGFAQLGGFRGGYAGNFGAEKIVGLGDVNCEMSEGHLSRRRFERKFIGGHDFDGGNHVFGGAG